MDVLLGRGRRPGGAQGTRLMYQLIHERRDEYESATKKGKTEIAESILEKLKGKGCRFLKDTQGGHEECDDVTARKKIAHSFRNERGRSRSKSVKASKHRLPS